MRVKPFSIFGFGILSFLALASFVSAQVFEDSNIFTFKSGVTSGSPEQDYAIFCSRSGDNKAITVSWFSGALKDPHGIYILGAKAGSGLATLPSSEKTAVLDPATSLYSVPAGDYLHDKLDETATYQYQLKAIFTGGANQGQEKLFPTSPISCSPHLAASDTPDPLNVWALGPNSLFANWKDNAVRDHVFELRKIKLTPKPSAFGSAPNPPNRKIKTLNSGSIEFYWTNLTNTQSQKGPFYHFFERVALKNGVNPSDPFAVKNNITEVKRSFSQDMTWSRNGVQDTIYRTADTNLTEATDYFYRLKACSLFQADLNKDGSLLDVCSGYETDSDYVATTTLPNQPANFVFTGATRNSFAFAWTDKSNREDGYEITVSPCPSNRNCAATNGEYVITDLQPNTTAGAIDNLDYGTVYTIAVRAFYRSQLPDRVGKKVYSEPLADARTTWYKLTTDPSNGGSIDPDCPTPTDSGLCYFNPYDNLRNGTLARPANPTITAAPIADCPGGVYEFLGLRGDCSTDPSVYSCSVKMNSNRAVRASYNLTGYCYVWTDSNHCGPQNQWTDNATQNTCSLDSDVNWPTCPQPSTTQNCVTTVTGCTAGKKFCAATIVTVRKRLPGAARNNFPSFNLSSAFEEISKPFSLSNVHEIISNSVGAKADLSESAPAGISSGSTSMVWKALAGTAHVIAEAFRSIFQKVEPTYASHLGGNSVPVGGARAQTIEGKTISESELDNYFQQFVKNGSAVGGEESRMMKLSTYEDKNLDSDMSYLYKVKTVYLSGAPTESEYSQLAAGRTLPSGLTLVNGQFDYGICERNSFCGKKIGASYRDNLGIVYTPQDQCLNGGGNSACRNIGTSRQFFEEVKPR